MWQPEPRGGGGIFGFSICPAQHGSISGGWDLVQSSGHLLPYIINSLKIWSHGMVDCCAIIRVFKVFKIFQFKNIPKSENHWSQLFLKTLVNFWFLWKNQWKTNGFIAGYLIFSKSFDNHGYIRIFVFTKKSRLWILRIALMITVGVCSSVVVQILVFFNTRWVSSCKFLKFDLHVGYQIIFFQIFWTNMVSIFWNGKHTKVSILVFSNKLITTRYA
jgi:hypothetical protein